MRYVLPVALFSLLFGCADPNALTLDKYEQIEPEMPLGDVEKILGKDYSRLNLANGAFAGQWIQGDTESDRDNRRTIYVSFDPEGRVTSTRATGIPGAEP